MKKRLAAFFMVAGILSAMLGGTAETVWGQSVGGVIKVRKPLNITGVDPQRTNSIPEYNILNNIVEGLVTVDGAMTAQPMLAKKWEIKNDGMTYIFTLRQGVKFHNGKEMTAEDVKYSLERFKAESPRRADLAAVSKIEIAEKYQIRVSLSEKIGPFINYLANPYTLAIIPKDSAKPGEMILKPVGTGPFKFVEWQPDVLVKLERFKDYQPVDFEPSGLAGKKVPYFEGAIFRFISEPATANAGLETGQLDYSRINSAPDAERLTRNPNIKAYRFPSFKTWSLMPNHKHPLYGNRKFREALFHAIDRKAIIEGAMWGEALPACSYITPQLPWFTEEHKLAYDFNPEKSKALLKEIGYKGEKVIIQPSTHPIMQKIATVLQPQFKAVGLNVEIQTLEFSKWMDYYQKGGWDILLAGHTFKSDPDQIYKGFFHSTQKFTANGFSNKEFDRLVEMAYHTSDFNERKKLYAQCQKIFFEEIASLPLIHDNLIYLLNSRIEGFKPYGADFTVLWNMWFRK